MAILYVVDDRMAVDEHGARWLLDEDGSWQRGPASRRPQLHLVRPDEQAEAGITYVDAPRQAAAEA